MSDDDLRIADPEEMVPADELAWNTSEPRAPLVATIEAPAPRQQRRARERAAGKANGHGPARADPFAVEIEPAPIDDRLTEAGAAERFARLHGDDLRFDHRRLHWLLWHAHRWRPDADAAVTRLALEFARAWQRQAVEIPERERREAVLKAGLRLERREALQSMLALSHDLKPIANTGDGWNRGAMQLGAPNGVVELEDGTLRPGRREDAITMSTAVAYDPAAPCPRFERFVSEIFGGDDDLAAFVQRAVGYSLTGETGEQCLFLCYGTGSNGKGTLLNTLRRDVLGDYGHALAFTTIEHDPRPGAQSNELAALAGRRFVVSSETNEGRRLNEGRIKWLTGCDPIRARFLYAESFEFEPVAKFWLAVNHKPIVADDSHGFWRRIRLIPFTQTFPVDDTLAAALRSEAPGILAWAVRGCLAWQRAGLRAPAVVTDATREYERDSDPLGEFIDAAIDREPESEVRAGELYEHYCRWAKEHGLSERERLTATAFGRRFGERFTSRRVAGRKVYLDVARRVL